MLLALHVLILGCEFCEELFPDGVDIVDLLEGVNPFPHGSRPLSDEWSLDKREGEGNPLDVRPHAGHLAIESDVCLQLVDEVVGVHSISREDGGQCAHHLHILDWLSGLLGCIEVRWARWSSSSSSSAASSSSSSAASSSSSLFA